MPDEVRVFLRTHTHEQVQQLFDRCKADPELRSWFDAMLDLHASSQWMPLVGPQLEAFNSEADELFYGGAAGGGKSDLILGLARTVHYKSIIYRREATQLVGLVQRMVEIMGSRDGYTGHPDRIWRLPDNRVLEFGAVKDPDSPLKYQGRPHDLKAFDEITHFLQDQYQYLNGWKRTTREDVRPRTVVTGNPPSTPEGRWVVKYWAPWLDRQHPLYGKVEAGELAWAWTDENNVMHFKLDPEPVILDNGDEIIPTSRTFIPSHVEDNPYYMATGYKAQLMALPEPLRSQLLKGDFMATSDDDPYQVIPTLWVDAAMERWKPKGDDPNNPRGPMDSVGCDPARGGRDETIISRRHGWWFDELLPYPGGSTPNGPTVASLVVANMRDSAPVHVDVIGIGSSVVDFLRESGVHTVTVVGSAESPGTDESGQLRFTNLRSWLYWRMRDLLDPSHDYNVALPPDDDLRADLCAPHFKVGIRGVQVESKEEIFKRLGRSTDRGDAVIYASMTTMKRVNGPGDRSKPAMAVGHDYDPTD